jgi:hypothetical protein
VSIEIAGSVKVSPRLCSWESFFRRINGFTCAPGEPAARAEVLGAIQLVKSQIASSGKMLAPAPGDPLDE